MHKFFEEMGMHALKVPAKCFVCDADNLDVSYLFTAKNPLWLLVFVLCESCIDRGRRSGWSDRAAAITAADVAALRVRWKAGIDSGR